MVTALSAFLAVATLLIIAPGPDSLLVVRNTVRSGRAGGLVTAAGTLTGLSLWAVASAAGLSALVQASQIGYDALRLAGAAYLVWLGVVSFRACTGALTDATTMPDAPAGSTANHPVTAPLGQLYAMGTLSNLLNPKIGVFFVALLPAFIPSDAPVGLASAALGLLFVIETGVWLGLLSWFVLRGARWLRKPQVQKGIDRLAGVVLIGLGIRLATEAR